LRATRCYQRRHQLALKHRGGRGGQVILEVV
jgi:hypothetical protein